MSKVSRVFTRKQYQSGDGMLTTIWGPNMWHYLHTISFNYPIKPTFENKKKYKVIILNHQHTLPCKYCRINLKNNFKVHPLKSCYLMDRTSFSRYIYKLHEIVNKMLNKNSVLSYCYVRERYEHFRSRCTQDVKNPFSTKELKMHLRKTKRKKEKGCTEPLYGKKSQCVIKIIPQNKKIPSFQMDKKCMKPTLSN